jgi:hypothetical protein
MRVVTIAVLFTELQIDARAGEMENDGVRTIPRKQC